MSEIGKKYGPYEILGNLGGGGMGFVYRAWDARLHREVAIKLLHGEYKMQGMRERFLREARAASALNHPNICTIFDIGEQDGEPYLVMELLQGKTLKELIDDRTVQVEEIVQIARDCAEGLGAAHAKGVIHRDIKPANIFLVDKPNGVVQAKVLDFGLAKFQSGVHGLADRSLDLTAVGSTVGTLAYMSPEQARGEVLDSRSDLFSLGVVLYEMATRHIPFAGATSALVFVQLLNHQPESVRNWNEAVPKELERIIVKLMAKERAQRFQTAQELEDALNKVGEKSSGWFGKATSNVPLVRTADPVAYERRPGRRASSDPSLETTRPPAPPQPASPAPRISADNSGQVLRPVPRIPQPPPVGAPSEAVARVGLVSEPEPRVAAQHMDSGEFAAAIEQPYSARPEREASRIKRPLVTPLRIGVAVTLLLLVGLAAFLIRRNHFGSTILSNEDAVVLTEVENRTGDNALDGVVSEGLQITLAESPYLRLVSRASYHIALRQIAPDHGVAVGRGVDQQTARKLRARAYISGTITGSTAPYLIHLDVLSTESNQLLTSAEDRVPSIQQFPAAIDRLASAIRSGVGEGSESINRTSIPLSVEATSDFDALHALSLGDAAVATGKTIDALQFYQQAVALQPRFVQAQLRLAVLYRKERAETAAAETARLALAAADRVSERTRMLAQYEYEMNASGDFARAATIVRQLVSRNPHDADALEKLARTLRLQGLVNESLQTAQQAYTEDPYNLDSYTQAQNALIGLDRFPAAGQLSAQAQKYGMSPAGGALTAAYLEKRQDGLTSAINSITAQSENFRADWFYGIYLDNVGQLTEGATFWRRSAAASLEVHGLESGASVLLAQGAVDRALLDDCGAATALAHEAESHPEGMTALFNTGMTYAVCGDAGRAEQVAVQLQQSYPQSFAVNGFYLANIRGAIALHDEDPATALDVLKPARQYDLISLTPLLRGRAHVALRQVPIGIVDFQTVLSHRGVPFIVGSVDYPVAQIGVARAFADTGDLENSAAAYRAFINLWKDADPAQPLLTEARAHSH